MQHTLHEVDGGIQCTHCGRFWTKTPDDDCMGVRKYDFGTWDGLMTANQLGIMGYRSERKHLPAPVGYYWQKGSKRPRRYAGPVFLYDPAQATPKKPTTKQRVTAGVDTIAWPCKLLYLLDDLIELIQEGKEAMGYHWGGYWERRNRAYGDVIQCASALAFGKFEEVVTEDCLTLSIPPTLLHRRYQQVRQEDHAIAYRLIEGYQKILEEKE